MSLFSKHKKVKSDDFFESIVHNRAQLSPDAMYRFGAKGPMRPTFEAMMHQKRMLNQAGGERTVQCVIVLLHQPGWDHLSQEDVAMAFAMGIALTLASSPKEDPKRVVYSMLAATEHDGVDNAGREAYFTDLNKRAIANMHLWTEVQSAP